MFGWPGTAERRVALLRSRRDSRPRTHFQLPPLVRISYHLGVPRSTVGRILARYRMPLLAHLDQATGLPVRKPKPVRYEAAAPGDLVHVDIKKLGKIPDGAAGARSARIEAAQEGPSRHRPSGPCRRLALTRLRVLAPCRRRSLPVGLLRAAPRRTQGDRSGVLGKGQSLLR